jgi:hypothetical protein
VPTDAAWSKLRVSGFRRRLAAGTGDHLRIGAVTGVAGIAAGPQTAAPIQLVRPGSTTPARSRPGMRGSVVSFMRGRHDPHQRRRLVDGRGCFVRQLKNGGIAEGLVPYCTITLYFLRSLQQRLRQSQPLAIDLTACLHGIAFIFAILLQWADAPVPATAQV